MSSELHNKHILIIGTGNMCQPMLPALLKQSNIKTTLITGTSKGRDKTAIISLLQSNNIASNNIKMVSHNSVDIKSLNKPDIIIFAVKPHFLSDTLKFYDQLISDKTILLTIIAGIDCATYLTHLSSKPQIARIMPHLPKAVYALYATSQRAKIAAKSAFIGFGEPIDMSYESDIHGFTAISGSAPAFIVQFISSFENTAEPIDNLRKLANGNKSECIKCTKFYNNYKKASKCYLSEKLSTYSINKTLIGTLKDFQESNISANEYVAKVRSAKGITNAGLLFMGNPPPNNTKFGTNEEISEQQHIANESSKNILIENSIIYAIISAYERSKHINYNPDSPLYGVDQVLIKEKATNLY